MSLGMSAFTVTQQVAGVIPAQVIGALSTTTAEQNAKYSPGLAGFIAIFVVAIAVIFLAVNMSRRIRRLHVRARYEEQQARQAASATESTPEAEH